MEKEIIFDLLNNKDANGETYLHKIAHSGDMTLWTKLKKYALGNGMKEQLQACLNSQEYVNKNTPLHIAVANEWMDLVNDWVDMGADKTIPNAQDQVVETDKDKTDKLFVKEQTKKVISEQSPTVSEIFSKKSQIINNNKSRVLSKPSIIDSLNKSISTPLTQVKEAVKDTISSTNVSNSSLQPLTILSKEPLSPVTSITSSIAKSTLPSLDKVPLQSVSQEVKQLETQVKLLDSKQITPSVVKSLETIKVDNKDQQKLDKSVSKLQASIKQGVPSKQAVDTFVKELPPSADVKVASKMVSSLTQPQQVEEKKDIQRVTTSLKQNMSQSNLQQVVAQEPEKVATQAIVKALSQSVPKLAVEEKKQTIKVIEQLVNGNKSKQQLSAIVEQIKPTVGITPSETAKISQAINKTDVTQVVDALPEKQIVVEKLTNAVKEVAKELPSSKKLEIEQAIASKKPTTKAEIMAIASKVPSQALAVEIKASLKPIVESPIMTPPMSPTSDSAQVNAILDSSNALNTELFIKKDMENASKSQTVLDKLNTAELVGGSKHSKKSSSKTGVRRIASSNHITSLERVLDAEVDAVHKKAEEIIRKWLKEGGKYTNENVVKAYKTFYYADAKNKNLPTRLETANAMKEAITSKSLEKLAKDKSSEIEKIAKQIAEKQSLRLSTSSPSEVDKKKKK